MLTGALELPVEDWLVTVTQRSAMGIVRPPFLDSPDQIVIGRIRAAHLRPHEQAHFRGIVQRLAGFDSPSPERERRLGDAVVDAASAMPAFQRRW